MDGELSLLSEQLSIKIEANSYDQTAAPIPHVNIYLLWIGVGAMALPERPGNPLRTDVCLGGFTPACFESRYSAVIRPGAPARASEDDVLEVAPRVRDHKWMTSDATSTWSHLDSDQ
jgi:hypothetical protein